MRKEKLRIMFIGGTKYVSTWNDLCGHSRHEFAITAYHHKRWVFTGKMHRLNGPAQFYSFDAYWWTSGRRF